MVPKKIYRYTNAELLDLIKNGTKPSLVRKAESELNSRNLSLEQKKNLESEYLRFKTFQTKRKNEPLTTEEWLSFFFLPFFTPKPKWREDHFSESEMERFEHYGFHKKVEQAKQIKKYGMLFWFITTAIIMFLITLKS